jgi:hypothetical protein
MRHRLVLALAGLALAAGLASTALAAGPGLGTATFLNTSKLTYTTSVSGNTTTLAVRPEASAEAPRRLDIPGKWGIPRVTFNADVGGLSQDGRLLVLQTTDFGQPLRAKSGFVTVDTRKLAVVRTINLNGDFAYDAIAPNGRTLYLIEHFSNADSLRYRVRAFDLKTGRLLPQIIVDKREPNEPMSGMPSARVATADGRKVFTLYVGQEHPFVHLLDTVGRYAFCIDLPKTTDTRAIETAAMKLSNGGTKLTIVGTAGAGARHVIDVNTLKVS